MPELRRLVPAALFLLCACAIESDPAPGDPFDGADFAVGDASRADLTSVEAACASYCALQNLCDGWDAQDCVAQCVEPKLDDLAASPQADLPNCSDACAAATSCMNAVDCDSFTDCDTVLDEYVTCTLTTS